MNQRLDPQEFPSICFEGELLPQSLSGISILSDCDLTDETRTWVWRFPICKEVWKEADPASCISSVTEIINLLIERRTEIVKIILERLGPHGFDGATTIDEWLGALVRILDLSKTADGSCRWIAGEPTQKAEETRLRILSFLDTHPPGET